MIAEMNSLPARMPIEIPDSPFALSEISALGAALGLWPSRAFDSEDFSRSRLDRRRSSSFSAMARSPPPRDPPVAWAFTPWVRRWQFD
jgi:hypothetical protein